MSSDVHPKTSNLRVYFIPADVEAPMGVKTINNRLQDMQQLVEGYIEIVRLRFMVPRLSCGCPLVMVVNEEGLLRRLPHNPRANVYYPMPNSIFGDVFLVGEGLVPDETGLAEPDFFSLPPELDQWQGPGHPLPTRA